MKYSTFKKEMERKGLIVTLADDGYLYVETNKATVGKISLRETSNLNTDFRSFNGFGGSFKRMLLQTFTELANTPPEEREDEKKYRLKLPFGEASYNYLNMIRASGKLIIESWDESASYKTAFTESEIDTLKAKYNLDSFVMEMVKDDEQSQNNARTGRCN